MRITKAEVERENARMRIAIEAALKCHSFEKPKGILSHAVTHADMRRAVKP